MDQEKLDQLVTERICNHMNKDHKNAIRQYAIHYGKCKNFKEVIMTNLTCKYFELSVDQESIQIPFDHTLLDSEDAHKTLVSMLKVIPKGANEDK
tara:strand:- start:276 stop:560 length:285 start_codon:yes stop_codon:yes gene_type:complete